VGSQPYRPPRPATGIVLLYLFIVIYGDERQGFDFWKEKEIFVFSAAYKPPLGQPRTLPNNYTKLFPAE
jgi:hypothetical protein